MSEYPYCPHGTYVGGCGADFMCGPCELGDAEPTANEQAAYVRRLYSRAFDPQFGVVSIIPILLATPSSPRTSGAFMMILRKQLGELERERAFLAEIRKYSRHENDHQWIWKRHGERRAEWDRLDDTQQFDALPDAILDGSY